MPKYKVVDLFCGAGGLSLGFAQSDYYQIVAAAENNANAKETYKKYFSQVKLLDDVKAIDYKALKKEFGHIDVVIGGPPCQGFSNANRQKANAISTNNSLVKEYVRAVRELKPDAFVMENVSMLQSDVHRFYFSKDNKKDIRAFKIELKEDVIELLPKKYRLRPAARLLRTLDNYQDYLWDPKYYKAINVLYRQRNSEQKFIKAIEKYKKTINFFVKEILKRNFEEDDIFLAEDEMAKAIIQYTEKKSDFKNAVETIERSLMFQRMYMHYAELINNNIIVKGFNKQKSIEAKVLSFSVLDYIEKILVAEKYSYNIEKGILNAVDFGVPQKRERFIMIGIKNKKDQDNYSAKLPKGTFTAESYRTVRDAISDLEMIEPSQSVESAPQELEDIDAKDDSLCALLRDSNKLYNHVNTATKEAALERFRVLKPGQNFHDLADEFKSTYADEKRTQNTIYLRLKYDEPSGTVVNVRKSMWIHPICDRALSIREAARLQTFPDSFIFKGTKDSQYQQVGNAVPPMLAKAIAEEVASLLQQRENRETRNK